MPKYKVSLEDGHAYLVDSPTELTPEEATTHARAQAQKPAARTWTDTAIDTLPMVGGTVGGLLGAPAGPLTAVGGAALGGAAGEGLRHAIQSTRGKEQPWATPGEAVTDLGVAGAEQGAFEGAGRVAGTVFKKLAPKVMDAGLWRSGAQRLDFPNTPQRLVDEGIVPRGTNVQKALTATEGDLQKATAAYDAAHPPVHGFPGAGPVDPTQIATAARDFAHTEGKVGGLGNVPGPAAKELDALQQEYLAQNTRGRSLGETLDQKRAYQARASYPSRPNAPTQTSEQMNFNKGVAGANRDAAIRLDPSIEEALAKEQDLIGADVAQKTTAARGTPMTAVGVGRHLLTSPTVMGGTAITLDRLGRALTNKATPAAIRATLLALMASHPSTQETP
jgi:hypothetical protein